MLTSLLFFGVKNLVMLLDNKLALIFLHDFFSSKLSDLFRFWEVGLFVTFVEFLDCLCGVKARWAFSKSRWILLDRFRTGGDIWTSTIGFVCARCTIGVPLSWLTRSSSTVTIWYFARYSRSIGGTLRMSSFGLVLSDFFTRKILNIR